MFYFPCTIPEEKFALFYDKVLHDSKDLTAAPTLPQRKKIPEGVNPHV